MIKLWETQLKLFKTELLKTIQISGLAMKDPVNLQAIKYPSFSPGLITYKNHSDSKIP